MTEIKKESGGAVRIATEVIKGIAQTAATEADGVLRTKGMQQTKSGRFAAKCTSVAVTGRKVSIALTIAVKMGIKIHEVSHDVQKRVKTAIETMTGLEVATVNVTVGAVVGEKKSA